MTGYCKVAVLGFLLPAFALPGCATPAHPEFDELTDLPAQKALNGEYVVTFHTRWFGPIYGHMTAQQTSEGFKANTEPGVAWTLVGGLEQVVGQLLAPFLFPNGMLLVWQSTLPDEAAGTPGEGWIGPGVFDPWRAATRMSSIDGPVEVRYRDGRVIAVMTLERAADAKVPATDYARLTDDLQAAVRSRLFDRERAGSVETQAFFEDVRGALPKVHDDLTYLAALSLAWRKRSDVALPMPYRARDPETTERLLSRAQNPIAPMSLAMNESTGVATVEAVTFLDAAQVDAVMREAVSKSPRALIVDLRNCTGLELSAIRMVSWLTAAPVEAGVVFSGDHRAELIPAKEGPKDTPKASAAAVEAIGAIDLAGPGDYARADAQLESRGVVRTRAIPVPDAYRGPVVVLTSSRTRSTGELLAWLLQHSGRARVVGERTAGRPRLSRERDLGQGFVLRVDEFDWLGPGGERLDVLKGVRPDVPAARLKAPARAARLFEEPAPQ